MSNAKLLLLISLIFGTVGAFYPVNKLLREREQSRQTLTDTIIAIQRQLPAADDPHLQEKMPLYINNLMRRGIRYYPKRNAYKYTFWKKYSQNHRGEPEGENPNMPEPLEQRSIWFQPVNGEWHCYAGMKKHVRGNLCNQREILNGLTVNEHETALWVDTCTQLEYWLNALKLPYKTGFYKIESEKEDTHLNLNSEGLDAVLALISEKNDSVWHVQYTPNSKIRAVILGGEVEGQQVYGLPPQTPVFDYTTANNLCSQINKQLQDFRGNKLTTGYLANWAGVERPVRERVGIDKTDQNPVQIGKQENQQWISSPTLITAPFGTERVRLVQENNESRKQGE